MNILDKMVYSTQKVKIYYTDCDYDQLNYPSTWVWNKTFYEQGDLTTSCFWASLSFSVNSSKALLVAASDLGKQTNNNKKQILSQLFEKIHIIHDTYNITICYYIILCCSGSQRLANIWNTWRTCYTESVRRSALEPKKAFLQIPRWCWYCLSGDYILRNNAILHHHLHLKKKKKTVILNLN